MTRDSDNSKQAGELRYRNLYEKVPICIFTVDLTTIPAVILAANPQMENVYGYTSSELVGMPVIHLVPETAVPDILSIMQRVQQGQTVTVEIRNKRRDSASFPVRIIATPDPMNANQMIATVENITAKVQRKRYAQHRRGAQRVREVKAIDAERHRIAQEIHDGVAQSLGGLRFKSGLWRHLAGSAPPAMRAALDELHDVLNNAIIDIRRAIFDQRPLSLEAMGFIPAVTQLVNDFRDQHRLVIQLDVVGLPENLPAHYELHLFRIIQESMNNIGKHARADSALVRLNIGSDGGIAVLVRDDGCGFAPGQTTLVNHNGHFGLSQMRERILALGGTLVVKSAVGQGTELVIILPPITEKECYVSD